MKKFINCNILEVLYEIMRNNTIHFQTDFEVDKEIITKAATSPEPLDRNLVWLSYLRGTHCHRERDLYVKDSYPYNNWTFYGEEAEAPFKAYGVEIKIVEDGIVKGDLYELDFISHYKEVKAKSINANIISIVYEDGSEENIKFKPNWKGALTEKKVNEMRIKPADITRWNNLISEAHEKRHTALYSEWDLDKLKQLFEILTLNNYTEQEWEFLNSKEPLYAIYQVKKDKVDYRYNSLDTLQNNNRNVDRKNYDLVYTASLPTDLTWNDVEYEINNCRPADYSGRDISTSDVIVFNEVSNLTARYVDLFGFPEIPNFMKSEAIATKTKDEIEM